MNDPVALYFIKQVLMNDPATLYFTKWVNC